MALHFQCGALRIIAHLRIIELKPREFLNMTAAVIGQAPVRAVMGEFADALYPHQLCTSRLVAAHIRRESP